LRIEPLDRGGGFVFESAVVGGAIPSKFIPSVEKGVAEAMQRGGIHGHPVVDVKATVYDGKFHNVDSDEMSFKTAGRLAFRAAMAQAGPVVLEPISKLEVTVPTANQGDIMGDLNARRGRVQGTEMSAPHEQTITAFVPTAEILRYAIDLRSMTGGRGRFTAEHDHYDPLPAHLVDQVSTGGHHEED
jgi:elongation factor G